MAITKGGVSQQQDGNNQRRCFTTTGWQ